MRSDFDAVIIGAGPAGSAAAILLARAGLSVALVEKERFPRRKVCGECIAASNLPLLDALGIGAALEASAGPELRQVGLMRGASCIVADLPPAPDAGSRWGRALGREKFDTLLLDQARAEGALVLQPWRVSAIDGQRCRLDAVDSSATMMVQARVIVAANGSWEALPSARQVRSVGRKPSDLFAFKANFRDTSLQPGLLPVLSFDGGYGGMVVAGDGMTTVACCVRRDRLQSARRAAPGLRAGDAIESLLQRECGGVEAVLQTATRAGPWIAAGPLHPGVHLTAGETFFRIGNAAGEAHPIIGEGISMALQSAFLLCTHLITTLPSVRMPDQAWRHDVGRRYAAEWRRAFEPRLMLAATFAHAAMRNSSGRALLALGHVWPGLLTHGARWSGKVRSAGDPDVAMR
ncbi:MAG TPA: FAD-dependent oxidoreductase [Burkholderiaceae bacterium]|nr:FAD-dependent oxidoreductase [Burkholderiaceae bacterium]